MLDLHHLPGSSLEEHKIAIHRAHWITQLPLIISTILVVVIPIAGYVGFSYFNPGVFDAPGHQVLFILGASLFFLFGWLFVFQSFIDYWLDLFIVTDKRILDVEQKGLFNRTVSELRLYRIQDVTAQVKGIFHTIFNYGNIYVQTAAETERFEFNDIPHPNRLTKAILEMSEEDRKEHLDEAVEEFGMPDKGGHPGAVKKVE